MKSIRRFYFYLVAFISIEVVAWGLVGLLRSIVDESVSGGADALAQALALILVGVPIFLIHWLWAQRASARDEEENSATLRAVFLYGILLATLIPVAQNVLSFIDRSLIQGTGMDVGRSFSPFREQTIADNLIAIGMNHQQAMNTSFRVIFWPWLTSGSLVMVWMMNARMPTGGVTTASSPMKTANTPYQSREMSSDASVGIRIGMVRTIIGSGSMKVPRMM